MWTHEPNARSGVEKPWRTFKPSPRFGLTRINGLPSHCVGRTAVCVFLVSGSISRQPCWAAAPGGTRRTPSQSPCFRTHLSLTDKNASWTWILAAPVQRKGRLGQPLKQRWAQRHLVGMAP